MSSDYPVNQQILFVSLNGESAADGEFSSWSGEVMDLITDLQMEHKQRLIRAF
jgi:hypothetical protein